MKDWKLSRQYTWPGKHSRGPLRYFLEHKCEVTYGRGPATRKVWFTCWRPHPQEWHCVRCDEEAPAEIAFVADLAGCESRGNG